MKMRKGMIMSLNLAVALNVSANNNADQCKSLDAVNWLLGAWVSSGEKFNSQESWRRISQKTFEGVGETTSVKTGEIISAETMRLVQMSGEVFYLAKVKINSLPVAFKLVRCDEAEAEFSNPSHDFPQKLIYKRKSAHQLSVLVVGDKQQTFTVDYTLANSE